MLFLLFLPHALANSGHEEGGAINTSLPVSEWIIYSVASLFIVCFAGMMSGLTVGMMSLDELDLEIKMNSGNEQEKAYAKKVFPVVSKHHFLLVTLLVANAAAMETLPLLLDNMFNEIISIVMSVTFVLGFGEVIPQALCTGPNQLKIASKLVPIVKIVMVIFSPISWPIAKLLDYVLGVEHAKKFGNEDLKALVSLHEVTDAQNKSGLGIGQVNIIHGAIDLQKSVVKNHMIPIEKVYMISYDVCLDREVLTDILNKGYSRVPVYKGDNQSSIAGILHIKKLVAIKEGTPLNSPRIKLRNPVYVHPHISVLDLLGIFQEGKGHMALVTEQPEGIISEKYPLLGIITLENVMELLLKTDILDEDEYDLSSSKAMGNRKSRFMAIKSMTSRPGSLLHPGGLNSSTLLK